MLGTGRIDDIAATTVIPRFVGLHTVENKDGLKSFMAMAGNAGAGLVFQKRHARLIAFEGPDPVDGHVVAERAEFQLLPAA